MELEKPLGNEEHFMSSENVEVEGEALVFFVVDRLFVCEGDVLQTPLGRGHLGQSAEDEVHLLGRHLAVVKVYGLETEDGLPEGLGQDTVNVIPLQVQHLQSPVFPLVDNLKYLLQLPEVQFCVPELDGGRFKIVTPVILETTSDMSSLPRERTSRLPVLVAIIDLKMSSTYSALRLTLTAEVDSEP